MIVNTRRESSILIVVLLTFISCSKNDQQYSYAHYYGKESVPSSYLIKMVHYEGDDRTDIILSSKSKEGPFKQIDQEKYRLQKGGLDKVIFKGDAELQKPYLTTLNNECVDFLFGNDMDDVMATSLCFLGREDVKIGAKEYKNTFKFTKKKGDLDGVQSIIYYDIDFVLLKEEYVSGYTDEYRIIRLDTALKAWH